MTKIMFAASEGLPFSKSGGLGDVIGSLPYALAKDPENEVTVVLPLYKYTKDNFINDCQFIMDFHVYVNYAERFVGLWKTIKDGVVIYFIENDEYFYRTQLYGHFDDGERFSFYQKAILEMIGQLNYFPDVLNSNDWHTALLPLMCKHVYDDRYAKIKQVFTIHNLKFQGSYDPVILDQCLGIPMEYYSSGALRYNDCVNFMKGGIIYADKVATVSNTYAHEILTDQFGEGLNRVLIDRKNDLVGIVNGIDYQVYDSNTSEDIAFNYSASNAITGKRKNKIALQEEMGLEIDSTKVLVSMVSRLTDQKGIQLFLDAVDRMLEKDIQIVILGSGEYKYEKALKDLQNRHQGRVCFYCGYNEVLAKKIYAASDVFLMPSIFEPCGLSQLISMHLGTLPIVRETGGLYDTVLPYNKFSGEGTGFTFSQASSDDLYQVFLIVFDLYMNDRSAWRKLMKQAMRLDVSWNVPAREYQKLYESIK